MLKKHWKMLLAVLVIVGAMVFAFWYGGNSKSLHGWSTEPVKNDIGNKADTPNAEEKPQDETPQKEEAPQKEEEPQKEEQPKAKEPQNEKEEMICSMVIKCDTVFDNMDRLAEGMRDVIPKNGVIYDEEQIEFFEGESVFNVLQRELKKKKIHFEFESVVLYDSAYIEGINGLYEFDCGELSGWMYSVNGYFPNYGISRYKLKTGDKIEILYSCNKGKDIGGANEYIE